MDNNNLDNLLDDLQSSVARPVLNGPSETMTTTTGYREVSRSMMTSGTGQVPTTTREYQIEYLSPANSTTVAEERAPSPAMLNSFNSNDIMSGHAGNSSYKTTSYEYKSSGTSGSNAALLRDASNTIQVGKNISELDTLLDDLNSAQRVGFSRDYQVSSNTMRDGYDLEPAVTRGHVSRSSQRSYSSEQRYGSLNRERQTPSPARYTSSSLDREMGMLGPFGVSRMSPRTTSTTTRDVVYSSSRTASPSPLRREAPPSPSTGRHVTHQETYRYESKGTGGSSSSTTTARYRDVTPPRDRDRPPSPVMVPVDYPPNVAAKVSTLVREYERRASREEQEALASQMVRRSPSPAGRKTITTSTTYNYSSSSARPGAGGVDPPRTPPPHRSPSPVSFPMPPEPMSSYSSYRRDETYSSSSHRSRSRSPPRSPQPFPTSTTRVHTYQVSREREPPPRPFPTASPTPQYDQRPPKELNELMSSFSDTEMSQTSVRQYASDLEQRAQRQTVPPRKASPAPPTPPPVHKEEQIVSRNVAGPPVYYPPGVEMFQQREESMQQSRGGGYKGKAEAKYEYKMKQRSKESSKTGKAVVPVCLPLCCAMPCTIM